MFKTILVAIDGSDHAAKAAELGGDLAGKYDARLLLLNVAGATLNVDHVRQLIDVGRLPAEAREEFERLEQVQKTAHKVAETSHYALPLPPALLHDVGQVILEGAESKAKEHGAQKIVKEVVHGDPAGCILTAAEKQNADLILMGTRGLSDLEGIFIGSVSHKVSHLSHCTCITVK